MKRPKWSKGLSSGWIIPEEVPQGISTVILPDSECPAGARFCARALHTLVLRSRPRTLVVVASGAVPHPRMQSMGQVDTAIGSCSIDERLSALLATQLDDQLEVTARMGSPLPTLQRLTPLLCQVLAPGCRFIPILVPDRQFDALSMFNLGQKLGDALSQEHGACVIAGLNLPARDKLGSVADVTDDAGIIRHILDPDPKLFLDASLMARIHDFAPTLIALGHARQRQGLSGYLLEHGDLGTADSTRGAASLVL